jgi:hypothetical protein
MLRVQANSFLSEKEKQKQAHDCQTAYLHLYIHVAFFSPFRE